jgi:hypothetical protein
MGHTLPHFRLACNLEPADYLFALLAVLTCRTLRAFL